MERIMRKQQLCELAAELDTSFEETGEAIVADALPDLSDIVQSFAQVFVREKSVQDGSVLVSGMIRMNTLCKPEGGGVVRSMEIPITFSQKLRLEDARGGMLAQCSASVTEAEGKLLNPRKLGVRTVVRLHIRLYRETESSVTSGIHGDESVQILTETLDTRELRAVCSKNFTVIEEPDITQADVRDVLRSSVSVESTEAAVSHGRISCRGTAKLTLLYLDSRENLRTFQTELPFTQVLEQPGVEEQMQCSCLCSLRSLELEPGEDADGEQQTLSVTLGLCADLQISAREQYEVVKDAYSTAAELNWTAQPHHYLAWKETVPGSVDIQQTVPAGETVSRIVQYLLAWTEDSLRDDGGWTVTLRADILFTKEDGSLVSVSRSFDTEIPVSGAVRPFFSIQQITAAPEGDTVRISARLSTEDTTQELTQVETVGDIAEGELYPRREQPELVLYYGGSQQELWPIAKRCHITQDDIRAANGLNADSQDDQQLRTRVLLIPLMN